MQSFKKHIEIFMFKLLLNCFPLDGSSEKDVIIKWEDRKDGGIAIPPIVRNLPQHNITETVTFVLKSHYVSGTSKIYYYHD